MHVKKKSPPPSTMSKKRNKLIISPKNALPQLRSKSFIVHKAGGSPPLPTKSKGQAPQPTESLVMIAVCKDRSVKITVKGREEDVVEYGDEDEDDDQFSKQLASLTSSITTSCASMLSHMSTLKTLTNVESNSESINFAQGMAHDDMTSRLKIQLKLLVDSKPCPSIVSDKKLDQTKLNSFELWYITLIDLILDKIQTDLPQIYILCNTAVGETIAGVLSNAIFGKKGEKQRKSQIASTPLVLPSLNVFLEHTYLSALATATNLAITHVLQYQKENMSISSSSSPDFEEGRWKIFHRLCKVAGGIPGKVVDVIFPRPKLTVRVEEAKDKKINSFNIINSRHRRSVTEVFQKLLNPLTADITHAVSWHVCHRMTKFSFDFHKIDYDHSAMLLKPQEYKMLNPPKVNNELYGNKDPVYLEAAKDPEKLTLSAEEVCRLMRAPETEKKEEKKEEKNSSGEKPAYVPPKPSMFYVFMSTMAQEISRFCLLLTTLSSAPSQPLGLPCACVSAAEIIHRAWADMIRPIYAVGQDQPMDRQALEVRKMESVNEVLIKTTLTLYHNLQDRLNSHLNMMIIPGLDSSPWDLEQNYMSSSRVTYGISNFVTFFCDVANDVKLFKPVLNKVGDVRQRLSCLEIFARLLRDGVKKVQRRYLNCVVSRAMSGQWKVDVIIVLKFAAWFLEALNDTKREPKNPDNWLDESSDNMGETKRRVLPPRDSDTMNGIIAFAKETEADCNVLLWHLALLYAPPTELCERASSYEKMTNFGFASLISGPMLLAMFAPAKILTSKNTLKTVNTLLVNSIITGQGSTEKNFFKKLSSVKFPFPRILEYANPKASKEEVLEVIKKRGDVRDWSYPQLSKEEEEGRIGIVDFLNQYS
ncbi:hypothetical protein TL16_g02380 [Triparma laevis f. inornata]|uniref:Uncharacterized protein n=1 Tax=Triparma laevis f. inornata TaxID=1714386 RepID=A0A9W7E0F5_9STRA|nr:hypothetical protein TL16_g02380 [Triparma laevis f. inornata]